MALLALGAAVAVQASPPVAAQGVVPGTTSGAPLGATSDGTPALVPSGPARAQPSITPPRREPAPVVRSVAGPLPAPPARLVLPGLRIDAPVVAVGADAKGRLGVPGDPDVLGWWRFGARLGATRGSVVIDGHVDSVRFGIGVFARLQELRPGDRVLARDQAGLSHAYTVQAVRSYRRGALPAAVFAQNVAPRLVLITCGGRFDRRTGYSHNVVVYASPAAR